ncbi:STAT [Culex quinquefasciatus]|uniref:Signal transducer and activator of transcription n=1 Tax=Culex quinquefasciatus TaxID=7176 RepID=B0XAD4_CULQU|nr:STAT [Culex quinquefasciatus]|eukprot:XP_001866606.1 STAT [Culex quinquefasciatus]
MALPQNDDVVLIAIGRFFGSYLPESVQNVLESWLQVKIQSVQSNQRQFPLLFVQHAHRFHNDLTQEMSRILRDEPSGCSRDLQGALSTAISNLHTTNPVLVYSALVTFLQSREIRLTFAASSTEHQVNELAVLAGDLVRMVVRSQRDDVAQGLIAELQGFVERAAITVQQIIAGDLSQWELQRNEQRDEAASANLLNTIQSWWELLWNALWRVRERILTVLALPSADGGTVPADLGQLLGQTNNLLATLTFAGFVVEKQPPQVMKTYTRYNVRIRHMMGSRLPYWMESFSTSIVSESQARDIQQSQMVHDQTSGNLTYEGGQLVRNEGSNQLEAIFRNLQITRIVRPERVQPVPVTDQKFALVFSHTFFIGDLRFAIWNVSYPVVVIVHCSQESQAWATIVWDGAFFTPNRALFEVANQVSWNVLGTMLNRRFVIHMERPLTAQNLQCLRAKAARGSNQDFVTRDQFYRENLPNRTFSFWSWFYAALKVTRDHLTNIWNDGHMIGFIERSHAEDILKESSPGTFLVRFSDSQLGGITIAYVSHNRQVRHIEPFTAVNGRNLAEYLVSKIRQLPQLKVVYPGTAKGQAFGRYYPSVGQRSYGYVPVIPDYGNFGEEEEQQHNSNGNVPEE